MHSSSIGWYGEAKKNGLSSSKSRGFPGQEVRRPQLNFNLRGLDEQPDTYTSDNSTLHHSNTIEAPQICTLQARNIARATPACDGIGDRNLTRVEVQERLSTRLPKILSTPKTAKTLANVGDSVGVSTPSNSL
jgi:hypothetical protein